jgi:drug/metabolite transporter (DMT)-like permease
MSTDVVGAKLPLGSNAAGLAAIITSATCYGMSIPFARAAALLGVPGPDMAAIRSAVTFLCVAVATWLIGGGVFVVRGERLPLLYLGLVSAVVGIAYLSSVTFVAVGIAATIFYTFPLLILAASPFVEKAAFTVQRLTLFVGAFLGIAMAIGPSLQSLDWRGLALAALASAAAAVQFFMAARAPGGGGIASIFWMNSVMLPIALVVAVACGGPAPIGSVESAWLPVSLSVVFYVVGFVMQMRGLRMTSATAGGLVFCLEPVVATISATVVLREHLALSQYAGGIIVLAVIIVSLAPPRLRDRT